jgi:hypothetical protein
MADHDLPEDAPLRPYVKNAHTEELVDHYWGSINYISSLIKASELKAGLILSFYGILLNFVFKSFETLFDGTSNDFWLYLLVGAWFICTAASVFYCVRCFIPKIEGNYDKNMFFFGDITTKFGGIKEFSKTFYKASVDEEQLFGQLGEQIYIISKIAAWKFRNVKRAIKLLALGLMLLFMTVAYYLVLTINL